MIGENDMIKKKFKKGYTVGTYDLFHIGHLNLFRNAKKYCDELIVAVHSDEWVYQCKKRETIIPLAERMEIISELRCVDEVVRNDGLSKLDAWEKYQFDVAFIGEDWKGTEVWNKIERELNSVGVEVIYIPCTNGISTTDIREKIATGNNKKFENK